MLIPADERVTLVGKTGSGKTYFTWAILASAPRLVVCDPKGDPRAINKKRWNLVDFTDDKARGEFEKGKPGRLWVPGEALTSAEDWNQLFRWAIRQRHFILYVDEVPSIASNTGEAGRPFRLLLTRGRALGISVWCGVQRPRRIPVEIISEAGVIIMFRLNVHDDKKALADNAIGPLAMTPLLSQVKHSYILQMPGEEPQWYPPFVAVPKGARE